MVTVSSERVLIEQMPVGSYKNFSYIVADQSSKQAAVIDPAWDVPRLLRRLEEGGFELKYIVNTHAHSDHIQGNPALSKATGAKVVMSYKSLARIDIAVKDGDLLKLGQDVELRFILTPGHSPESMCVEVDGVALFTGDTLFVGECGRVDLPGGEPSDLYESFEKIKGLNPNLLIYPGHDYGPTKTSTLKREIETNYTLAGRTKDEFIKFMETP